MPMCFSNLTASPVLWGVIGVSTVAALVLFWMVKFQSLQGKICYALTFIAMIWTRVMIGFEAASTTFDCQLRWATLAMAGWAWAPPFTSNSGWRTTHANR